MEHAEPVTLAPCPSVVPAPRGGTGEAVRMGAAASVLLHLFVGAAAIGMSITAPSVAPPVIDLTLAEPAGDVPAYTAGNEAARVRTRRILDAGIRPDGAPVPVPASPATAPVFESPSPVAPPTLARESAATGPSNPSGPPEERVDPGAGTVETVPDGPAYSAFPRIAAPGSPHAVAANARTATVEGGREIAAGVPSGNISTGNPAGDFARIRDAIQRKIAYPATARRMGWEGKVVVAFRLLGDGSVRDVRIVHGSGHAALDRGAVDAVRNASPFPRTPAGAEVITPVVYRLSAAP